MLLLWAQVRFLPYHDTMITWWSHRSAVLLDLLLVGVFWHLMLMPAQGGGTEGQEFSVWREEQRQLAERRIIQKVRNWWMLGLACLALVTVVFPLGIAVLPEEGIEVLVASHAPHRWQHVDRVWNGKPVFWLTYWLFDKPGTLFHRNLQLQD